MIQSLIEEAEAINWYEQRVVKNIVFKPGDITKNAEKAEDKIEE